MSNNSVVACDGLFKTYGTIDAVKNLSLSIQRGEIYGLVGANGSGKTTLIRMITGLITPTKGTCVLGKGKDGDGLKIGAIVEQPSLYLNLSGQKNIEIACDIAAVPIDDKIDRLLKLVGLSTKSRLIVRKYSLGMKQRLAIAMALVNDPDFLILDEPTNGLDPQGIVEIRELLLRLNHETGITMLVSSHILSELGRLATRFGFIEKGVLIKESTLKDIEESVSPVLEVVFSDNEAAVQILKDKLKLNKTEKLVQILSPITVTKLVTLLDKSGIEVLSASYAKIDLEAYFFNLINQNRGGANNGK